MNAHPAVSAAERVFKNHKKRSVSEAEAGEAKIIGIAIGAKHSKVTKDHKTVRCRPCLDYA